MSAASIDRWNRTVVPAAAARLLRGWMPLYAWSRRRRIAVAGVIAAVVCALATLTSVTTDFAGPVAAQAALAAERRELADARHAQRALPALKEEAAASVTRHGPQRRHHSADDARHVSELAAAAGVSLVSLEPGAPGGQGAEAFRALKLSAQGDSAKLRAFLHGLAHAPVLIVPSEVAIKRNGQQLSLAATLSVFDALPSLPAGAETANAVAPPDPFAPNRADGAQAIDGLRLAGLMLDRTHAVALIETSRGTDAVVRGSRIDGERVVRIAMPEVTLATGDTTRVLKWTEDGR